MRLVLQGDKIEAVPRAALRVNVPGGSSRPGCSFSQPRLTTIVVPAKFGLRLMLRRVRIGMPAPGASIATPQP
jgi:hypothetical protein